MESQYINSRPFRVNAGAVHAYAQAPGGKTAYLSELRSGSEVLVADAAGRTRTAVVGRCKVEVRPMVRGLMCVGLSGTVGCDGCCCCMSVRGAGSRGLQPAVYVSACNLPSIVPVLPCRC